MTDPDLEGLAAALARAAGLAEPSGVTRMSHGMSGDQVLRLDGPTTHFAKIGDPARRISVRELEREIAMLRWLDGRAGAARVAWSGEIVGRPALVTEAIPGVALHALTADQAETGAIVALKGLAALHALPVADCPFDERLEVKLAEAARRMANGEVDASQMDDHNQGRDIHELWRELLALRPAEEDLVVTHGDACWPNLIWRPDGSCGLIDMGRAGVADRHQDLALFIRSGRHNFPDLDVEAVVAAHYPRAFDPGKLEFYRELDEFY